MKIAILVITFFSLTGYATQEAVAQEKSDRPSAITLTAGQSVILPAGESAAVPLGTVVRNPNGISVVINGHRNTIDASAGVFISVPVSAKGPPDNIVIAKPKKAVEPATDSDEHHRLEAIHAELEARRHEPVSSKTVFQCTLAVRMQSRAGDLLFRDLINAPGGVGTIDATFFPKAIDRRIVKIEVIAPYDKKGAGVERWTISHSGSDVVSYIVRLTADGHGGTNFVVAHSVTDQTEETE
ncbi:MAG TPA: hypothetical protein VK717_06340 [Opitutaceae bacterium]|jgi:hypothetical protein|nr:hypothetical protein [Opitutaceae bacterium]